MEKRSFGVPRSVCADTEEEREKLLPAPMNVEAAVEKERLKAENRAS